MIVVSDTSPIRGLLAIGKTDLLQLLFTEIIIPGAVEAELKKIVALQKEVKEFLESAWVKVKAVNHSESYLELRKILDEGESEAIALALLLHAHLLLMDENKGRTIAKQKGLEPLGLIGVLLRAKKLGLLAAVKPSLDELRNVHGFWLEQSFYESILAAANETAG
jgi:predicted nucleic acid-binding protein